MTSSQHRFEVGNIECRIISDGTITVPDTINRKRFDPLDPRSGVVMEVLCLYVRSGQHQVLIDTGCGNGRMASSGGKLLQNLANAGIKAEDIDTVIMSHAHSDHVGGNVYYNGRPVFSGARYIIHRREWEHWTEKLRSGRGDTLGMFEVTRKKLLPVQARIEMVDDKKEIIPGIEFIPVPGHTPGHMMLKISSGKSKLIHLGDLMHHPLELTRPEIYTIFDVDPQEAIRIRGKTVADLAASGVLVFACHFSFPGLGHIIQKNGVFCWEPLGAGIL